MTKTEAIELVQKDFENVISYSQNFCCDLDSDAILEQWYDNKKEFIDAMGDLIYEINTPISFELSADEQRKKIDNFLKTIRTVYHNEDLSWFLNKNRNGFFSNYVVEDYEYNGKKIPRGMKLVKAGGQITLWIPSALAYGENGAGANIGPNEALEFKVELLEVNPAE